MCCLLPEFPRERWNSGLPQTAAFWLQMHAGFRASQGRMAALVAGWRAGQTDARGCPARQPENGTPCTVNQSTGFQQCGYVLECTAYRKSAVAQCFNNGTNGGTTWNTTPLGTCD